jgi:hypothetical protein
MIFSRGFLERSEKKALMELSEVSPKRIYILLCRTALLFTQKPWGKIGGSKNPLNDGTF